MVTTVKLVPSLFALGLLATVPLVAQKDTIKARDGKQYAGAIESEDYKEIAIKTAKGSEKVPTDDAVAITYDKAQDLNKALNLVNAGKAEDAAKQLAALIDNKTLRKELRQHVMFQLAAANQRAQKLGDAVTAAIELVKAYPKTAHLRAAAQLVVECRAADPAAGVTDLQALTEAARAGGVDPAFLDSFNIYKGKLLEMQKKHIEARALYDTVGGNRTLPAALLAEAKLGVGRCEQATGHGDKAKEIYRSLADQQDLQNEIMAGAWNGLADLAKEDASKDKNAEKALDALYMYLRGVVEFGPAPGDSTSEYERALAGSAATFKLLSEWEKDENKKKVLADRAASRLSQLKKEFPGSPYLPAK